MNSNSIILRAAINGDIDLASSVAANCPRLRLVCSTALAHGQYGFFEWARDQGFPTGGVEVRRYSNGLICVGKTAMLDKQERQAVWIVK